LRFCRNGLLILFSVPAFNIEALLETAALPAEEREKYAKLLRRLGLKLESQLHFITPELLKDEGVKRVPAAAIIEAVKNYGKKGWYFLVYIFGVI
jgi:hypothetical protein